MPLKYSKMAQMIQKKWHKYAIKLQFNGSNIPLEYRRIAQMCHWNTEKWHKYAIRIQKMTQICPSKYRKIAQICHLKCRSYYRPSKLFFCFGLPYSTLNHCYCCCDILMKESGCHYILSVSTTSTLSHLCYKSSGSFVLLCKRVAGCVTLSKHVSNTVPADIMQCFTLTWQDINPFMLNSLTSLMKSVKQKHSWQNLWRINVI